MSFATQPLPDTIRIEVREMILGTVAIVILAGRAMLWPRRQKGEEFVPTLPADAPPARAGTRQGSERSPTTALRLRATSWSRGRAGLG